MSKDKEIRRLALLKNSMASVSSISVLNLSLEVLKTHTDPITVEKLYYTAGKIIAELPELKSMIDQMILESARKAEKWVTDTKDEPERAAENTQPEEVVAIDLPEAKASEDEVSVPVGSGPKPVEKADDVIVGEIKAVSKTGKGIKIEDAWYNITAKTAKSVEPERGKIVRIKFFKGNSGFLVETLESAA